MIGCSDPTHPYFLPDPFPFFFPFSTPPHSLQPIQVGAELVTFECLLYAKPRAGQSARKVLSATP